MNSTKCTSIRLKNEIDRSRTRRLTRMRWDGIDIDKKPLINLSIIFKALFLRTLLLSLWQLYIPARSTWAQLRHTVATLSMLYTSRYYTTKRLQWEARPHTSRLVTTYTRLASDLHWYSVYLEIYVSYFMGGFIGDLLNAGSACMTLTPVMLRHFFKSYCGYNSTYWLANTAPRCNVSATLTHWVLQHYNVVYLFILF